MIVTRQQMIQCELNSNLSVDELMEMAGKQCAYAIMDEISQDDRVLILSGKGNNGGDGFVIARILMQNHYNVQVYLAENTIASDTARMMADQLNPSVFVDEDIMNIIDMSDVIIDCIYGFSFRGAILPEMTGLFDAVNQSEARVISVDINSGLEADTGRKDPHVILSDITLALGHLKIAHSLKKDHQCFKELKLLDLGLPVPEASSMFEMNDMIFRRLLPIKAVDSYKNVNGRVLTFAGSSQTPGAAILSALAAWKTGIGYLHVLSEEKVLDHMIQAFPVAVNHNVHETSLSSLMSHADAIITGCGCDHLEHYDELLLTLLEDSTLPIVVDAYGLRVLSDHMNVLDAARAPLILTPHLGEFSALCSLSAQEIKKDKIQIAKQFAQEHGVTLVLKGPHTVVASADGRLYINQTGHQNLAKAGSGDVLAGLIGGFCAQNLDPFTASCMAVWMHGKASDLSKVPDPVFSAVDLLEALSMVYQS